MDENTELPLEEENPSSQEEEQPKYIKKIRIGEELYCITGSAELSWITF